MHSAHERIRCIDANYALGRTVVDWTGGEQACSQYEHRQAPASIFANSISATIVRRRFAREYSRREPFTEVTGRDLNVKCSPSVAIPSAGVEGSKAAR